MSEENLCKCLRTRNSFDIEVFENECPLCGKKVFSDEKMKNLKDEAREDE